MKVWDRLVRAAHWLLVAGVAAAWLTRAGWGQWHEWIGYATLALVALRMAWGWIGPRYARFSQFGLFVTYLSQICEQVTGKSGL